MNSPGATRRSAVTRPASTSSMLVPDRTSRDHVVEASGSFPDTTQHRPEQRGELLLLSGVKVRGEFDFLGVESRKQLLDLPPARGREGDADQSAVFRRLRTTDVP